MILLGLCRIIHAQTTHPVAVDHTALGRILKDTVRDELVDYQKIKTTHMASLRGYLDDLANADPDRLDRNEQLAFYINLYNATMIRAVVDRYKPGYSPAADDYAIFSTPLVRLKAKTLTLNELENDLIRPVFKDPRIHAALVCAARSCPPLLPRAYLAEDLDATLDQNMRRFVTDTSRNRVATNKKLAELSRIFDWYAEDFGGPAGVLTYIDGYHPADLTGYRVNFLDYSWHLNDTAERG